MSQELPNKLTPFSRQELLDALYAAWTSVVGSPCADVDSVRLVAAQISFEIGNGAACHNWNLGNVKAIAGGKYDWQYFACGEVINGKCVQYSPDNPAQKPYCCFRAFDTFRAGIADHLLLLTANKNFARAWPAVTECNPAQFCALLKQARYFTADLAVYSAGVCSIFREMQTLRPKAPTPNAGVAADLTYRDLLLIVDQEEDVARWSETE